MCVTRNAKYEHALIEYCDMARTSRVSLARANRVICIIELDIIKRKRRLPALKTVAKLFRVIERNRPLSPSPSHFCHVNHRKKERKISKFPPERARNCPPFLYIMQRGLPSEYIIKFRGS